MLHFIPYMYIRMYVHVLVYNYNTYVHIYTMYMYIYMCMYVHIHVHVYVQRTPPRTKEMSASLYTTGSCNLQYHSGTRYKANMCAYSRQQFTSLYKPIYLCMNMYMYLPQCISVFASRAN